MVFHVIAYGAFLLIAPDYSLFHAGEGSIHYLYAILILWPIELLIMALLNRSNKNKGAEAWVQEDVGAVDLTPWKYRWVATVLIILVVIVIYAAFSPLGFGEWGYTQPW